LRAAANAEAHKNVRDELRTAKQIKEERKKKESVRLRNMPKDKRKFVLEKRTKEWKAKQAFKEKEKKDNPWGDLSKIGQGGKGKKRKR